MNIKGCAKNRGAKNRGAKIKGARKFKGIRYMYSFISIKDVHNGVSNANVGYGLKVDF